MQYVGQYLNFLFLPVASNDNDDLLALASPSSDLAIIRRLKCSMYEENMHTGILLRSRKERRFLQEIIDAERYIILRYYTSGAPETSLRKLKRYILDTYLFPRTRRRKPAGN